MSAPELLADATPAEIELAAKRMYQADWDKLPPNKTPGERMKDVWRAYARRAIDGFLEARRIPAPSEHGGGE